MQSYLERSFGENPVATRKAITHLFKAFEPDELAGAASRLYEQFRPQIDTGKRGWGQKGTLDLDLVRSLASRK